MDFYLYSIYGLLLLSTALGFSMFIMYYKYVLRKRWDKRASCIEMATDTITENIKNELSDLTLDDHSVEEKPLESIELNEKKEKTLVQMIEHHPKEHPIYQEPLPEDIHNLFNPKLQPRQGALVQFSDRDLLSFPKTALSGNEMMKEIKLQDKLNNRDAGVDEDQVPLEILRKNSSKRVGRSIVKYPASQASRDPSEEKYAGSRHSVRNGSRTRAASRARSDVDDRHSKFKNPKYRDKQEFEDYYINYLVPTISAVVQQTLAHTLNPKNNYVDQWVNNNELGSVDGLQTPSLKSL